MPKFAGSIDRNPQTRYNLTGSAEPSVVDADDTIWFTYQRRLYRQRGKLRAPVFAEKEPNAFADGRSLRDVTLDNHGNAFVYTDHREECVLVRSKPPFAKTKIDLAVQQDEARIRLRSDSSGKHWFEWRLDGSPWGEPAESGEVLLEALANGPHRLVARTLDERLQCEPVPAVATFTVKVDVQAQVQSALRELASEDYAHREHAVKILVRRRENALPLLKSRRTSAGDAEKWWIDAAIQEIERGKVAPSPTPRGH